MGIAAETQAKSKSQKTYPCVRSTTSSSGGRARAISTRRMATPVFVAPDKCDANFFVLVLNCSEEGTNVHLPFFGKWESGSFNRAKGRQPRQLDGRRSRQPLQARPIRREAVANLFLYRGSYQ